VRYRFAQFWYVCAFCLLVPAAVFAAQRGRPTQYDVEAVYLYQFGRFIDWPPQSAEHADSFPICILGRDPFDGILDSTIAGEAINQVPLKAQRIGSIDEARNCRILFVSDSETARLPLILDGLRSSPVLTVSDTPGFASKGGMIGFVVQGNRVRFEINVVSTQRAGLTVSSQLLKVASLVRGAGGAEANP
jgi:hypothetical protein